MNPISLNYISNCLFSLLFFFNNEDGWKLFSTINCPRKIKEKLVVNYCLVLYHKNSIDLKSNLPISFFIVPITYNLRTLSPKERERRITSYQRFIYFLSKITINTLHTYKQAHTYVHTKTISRNYTKSVIRKIILILLFWHRKLMNDYTHDFDFHFKLILIWAHMFWST